MKPGILSRGYGAKIGPAPRVGQGQLDAALFGDEPALIARQTGAPLAVHPRRADAARALRHAYPDVDVIISDDGLQHLALARDIEIVVQDTRGTGNGRMLPAGPLREPASRLAEVDVVITNLGTGPISAQTPAAPEPQARPLAVTLRLEPDGAVQLSTGQRLSLAHIAARSRDACIVAAAGIGQPARFFDMLTAAGIRLAGMRALPDHHDWRGEHFDGKIDMVLVTAKDAVKCASLDDPRIWQVPVTPHFEPADFLDRMSARLVKRPDLH